MPRFLRRALAAATVVALLPVAMLAGGTLLAPHGPSTGLGVPLHSEDAQAPTPDAVHRASVSGLFAAFSWDGVYAHGTFVQFRFNANTGTVSGFDAEAGSDVLPLVETVNVTPFHRIGTAAAIGPLFHVLADSLTITAHDDPMTLLEYRTTGQAHTVSIRLLDSTTNVTTTVQTTGWPAASVSFDVGASRGTVLLGAGTVNVSENVVTANLTASDILVLKTVPALAPDQAERDALLDAFGAGRIVAEFALVSEGDGAWAESSAHYRLDVSAVSSSVDPGEASILLASVHGSGGLLLVAFDPTTMPSDPGHRIVVTANGNEIPEATEGLLAFLASPPSYGGPSFVRLDVNATALAISLPTVSATTVSILSIVPPAPAIDLGTAFAIVAALALVGYAAMTIFRRPLD